MLFISGPGWSPSATPRPRRCSPCERDSNGPSAWARDASRRGRAFFASTRVCTACQPPYAARWPSRNAMSSWACETRTRGCQRRSRAPNAVGMHGRPPHAPRARLELQSQGLREGNQSARRQVARRKLVERAAASAVVAERGGCVWKQGCAVRTAPAHRGHASDTPRGEGRVARRPSPKGKMTRHLRQMTRHLRKMTCYLLTTSRFCIRSQAAFSVRNHGVALPSPTSP